MTKPLVTVITPAYNCGKYLEETIRSVLTQGYPNLDYVIIDDCSIDSTRTILDSYGSSLKVIRHEQNQGEQSAVNDGLKAVFGKYFIIVNADDPLLPGSIFKLVDYMEANPDILCAYPDWQSINEDGTLRRKVQVREYDFSYLVRHHTWMMSVGAIFSKAVIDMVGYRDTSFRWLGDADYWLRIGLVGKMARYPETLACWRHRNGQASGDKSDARAQEHIRVMQKFFKYSSVNGYEKYYAEASSWSYIVAAAVTDSKLKSLDYLFTAASVYPQLIVSLEFWDVVRSRALHILRR